MNFEPYILELCQRIGWGLLHSLWQITALAVVYFFVSRMISVRWARMRYCFGFAVLIAMLIAPIFTMCIIEPVKTINPSNPTATIFPSAEIISENTVENTAELEDIDEIDEFSAPDVDRVAVMAAELREFMATRDNNNIESEAELWPFELDDTDLIVAESLAAVEENENSETIPKTAVEKTADPVVVANFELAEYLLPCLPYMAGIWAVGVLVLGGRLVRDWFSIRHLRVAACCMEDGIWFERLAALKAVFGLRGEILLGLSDKIDSPMLIGILKPMILVPCSLLSGFSPEEVEAILAHELAHIRRHDFLANLVQLVIETLLFYHPLLWWVSRSVRCDREYICDDYVVHRTETTRVQYAKTLAHLEQLRHEHYGEKEMKQILSSPAAAAKPLLTRIQRILKMKTKSDRSADCVAGLLVLGILIAVPLVLAAGERTMTATGTLEPIATQTLTIAVEPVELTDQPMFADATPAQPRNVAEIETLDTFAQPNPAPSPAYSTGSASVVPTPRIQQVEVTLYAHVPEDDEFVEITAVKRNIEVLNKNHVDEWSLDDIEIIEPRYRKITEKSELFPFTVTEFNLEGKMTQRTIMVPKGAFWNSKAEIHFGDGLKIKITSKGQGRAEVEYDSTVVARQKLGNDAKLSDIDPIPSIVRFEVDIKKFANPVYAHSSGPIPTIGRSADMISRDPEVYRLSETREMPPLPAAAENAQPAVARTVVTSNGYVVPQNVLNREATRDAIWSREANLKGTDSKEVRTVPASQVLEAISPALNVVEPTPSDRQYVAIVKYGESPDGFVQTSLLNSAGETKRVHVITSTEDTFPFSLVIAEPDGSLEQKEYRLPKAALSDKAAAVEFKDGMNIEIYAKGNGKSEISYDILAVAKKADPVKYTENASMVARFVFDAEEFLSNLDEQNAAKSRPGIGKVLAPISSGTETLNAEKRFNRGYSLTKIIDAFTQEEVSSYGQYTNQTHSNSSQVYEMISMHLTVALEIPANVTPEGCPFRLTPVPAKKGLIVWGTEDVHAAVKGIIDDLEKACEEIEPKAEKPKTQYWPSTTTSSSSQYSTDNTAVSPYNVATNIYGGGYAEPAKEEKPKNDPWAAIRATEELLAEKRELKFSEIDEQFELRIAIPIISEPLGVHIEIDRFVPRVGMVRFNEDLNISGEHLLRRILRPLGLTYFINADGEVIICEPETADKQLLLNSYMLVKSNNETAAQDLANAITELVEPEFWQNNEKAKIGATANGQIWVNAPYRIHKEIEKLL